MDAYAYARFQRQKPSKTAQVLREIRGKSVGQVSRALPYIRRRAATLVAKTVDSAAANLAFRLKRPLDPNAIYVKAAWVGLGPMKQLKRVRPAPQGRAMTIKRKMCHLTVVVSDTRGNGSSQRKGV